MRLHTQINLLKIVLLGPMRKYHKCVKDVLGGGPGEDLAFRRVAPPPDLGIFEL